MRGRGKANGGVSAGGAAAERWALGSYGRVGEHQ